VVGKFSHENHKFYIQMLLLTMLSRESVGRLKSWWPPQLELLNTQVDWHYRLLELEFLEELHLPAPVFIPLFSSQHFVSYIQLFGIRPEGRPFLSVIQHKTRCSHIQECCRLCDVLTTYCLLPTYGVIKIEPPFPYGCLSILLQVMCLIRNQDSFCLRLIVGEDTAMYTITCH
jgi:hypothetical protein